ncbi:hypothetical protein AVEN_51569-1 [Araneus ventricosus]|uniref:ribonuclease H n=1 Tax=Araneus ventricosus TaxID=182803 RepID=A0A4Y2PD76_ARAVE|nr:hypothetical protein AVEN_57217-1 [Araneus ventricosus]GBN49009.1 hypothetical protein AVEN_51569-1 [Araneus ventricosus]
MDRTKLFLEESALISLDVKQFTFFSFPPWSVPSINYIDPFSLLHKASTAPVVFYQVFNLHRSLYSQYVPVFTDGSKSINHVGCSVAFPDSVSAYRLNAALSIYTAEATAISCALQRISSENTRQFCIYTDSMSVLQSLQQTDSSNNPVICDILLQMEDLRNKGFDILFCWVPSHTGIKGNELADSAAKSALVPLNSAVPLSDVTCFIRKHINKMWQQLWDLQEQNKLHSLKPFLGRWPGVPVRRKDVILTRLRIGHTRFTHKHLLFAEPAPICTSCQAPYSVLHILIECPVFTFQRQSFFNATFLSLQDVVGENPHPGVFSFLQSIGFLNHI